MPKGIIPYEYLRILDKKIDYYDHIHWINFYVCASQFLPKEEL